MPKKSSFTQEDVAEYKRLTRIINSDGGYFPDGESHDLYMETRYSKVATEVLLTRNNFQEVLLTHRDDEKFHGWHFSGGYLESRHTIPEACLHHLRKDKVVIVDDEFRFVGIIHYQKWMPGEHPVPMNCPTSLLCVCEYLGADFEEDQHRRFFSSTQATTIPWHTEFQNRYFEWAKEKSRT